MGIFTRSRSSLQHPIAERAIARIISLEGCTIFAEGGYQTDGFLGFLEKVPGLCKMASQTAYDRGRMNEDTRFHLTLFLNACERMGDTEFSVYRNGQPDQAGMAALDAVINEDIPALILIASGQSF
jgi:hypothetical protein